MLKRYILWGIFIVIFVYLIKSIFEMFQQQNDEDREEEPASPEDLIPDTRFCPECNQSYKDEISTCPVCKVPTQTFEETFDSQPDRSINVTEENFERVFIARSQTQARMIQLALQEENIESALEETGGSMLPFESAATNDTIYILVPTKHIDKSKKIIQDFLQQHSSQDDDTITTDET